MHTYNVYVQRLLGNAGCMIISQLHSSIKDDGTNFVTHSSLLYLYTTLIMGCDYVRLKSRDI